MLKVVLATSSEAAQAHGTAGIARLRRVYVNRLRDRLQDLSQPVVVGVAHAEPGVGHVAGLD